MATEGRPEEEKAARRSSLKPPRAGCEKPEQGARRRTAELLHHLVVGRFSAAFIERGAEVPRTSQVSRRDPQTRKRQISAK